MDTLQQDVRFALRTLGRSRGFTAAAVLALALGIGGNTAVFSIVNGVLLEPLPYRNPDRIIRLYDSNARQNVPFFSVDPSNYIDWKAQAQLLAPIGAYTRQQDVGLSGHGEPEQVAGARVSPEIFDVLGVAPALGRVLAPADAVPASPHVVVIAHSLWTRRFGADPGLLGRTVVVDSVPRTVIGVMPAGFELPNNDAELWVPLMFTAPEIVRGNHFLRVLARLKPGVSTQQSQAELTAIGHRLALEYPQSNRGWTITIQTLQDLIVGQPFRQAILVLVGAVGFVLLIACANVANLLLARAATRKREMAVRTALGASRFRLVRQLLTENVLLAASGGALGLLFASWGIDRLRAAGPGTVPRLNDVGIDGRVLGFTALVPVLSGIVFGIIPALHVSSAPIGPVLKEGSRGSGGGVPRAKLRMVLVAGETGLALVLLIGAGLLIKSFWRLAALNPGFVPDQVLTVRVSLPEVQYPADSQIASFHEQLLDRIGELPGVRRVGSSSGIPLAGPNSGTTFVVEGRPGRSDGQPDSADFRVVTPGYFTTLGIPLLRGRDFTRADESGAPGTVIVDTVMAARYWPDENPIGRRLTLTRPNALPLTVVGLVGAVHNLSLDAELRATMYLPMLQHGRLARSMTIVIRSDVEASKVAPGIRSQIRALDRSLPLLPIERFDQRVSASLSPQRFNVVLLGTFSAVALVLACLGVYGVMSYTVAQRTHEIGMRMALGARPSDVVRLFVADGLAMIGTGVLAGLAGALAGTRVLSTLLFDVAPLDPASFGATTLLLAAVAMVACYVPARRAMQVDPMVALRAE